MHCLSSQEECWQTVWLFLSNDGVVIYSTLSVHTREGVIKVTRVGYRLSHSNWVQFLSVLNYFFLARLPSKYLHPMYFVQESLLLYVRKMIIFEGDNDLWIFFGESLLSCATWWAQKLVNWKMTGWWMQGSAGLPKCQMTLLSFRLNQSFRICPNLLLEIK